MATLADELENDFAASGSEDEDFRSGGDGSDNEDDDLIRDKVDADMNDGRSDDEDDEIDHEIKHGVVEEAQEERAARAEIQRREVKQLNDLQSVQEFVKKMEPVLAKIEHFQSLPPEKQTRNIGSVEENPEYALLTKSNTYSTSIDDHVAEVVKYLRDHYSARFPELETLLPDFMEYTKTVAVIGNGPMDQFTQVSESSQNLLGKPLAAVLSKPKVMTVTMGATTTKGRDLSEAEFAKIQEACRILLGLEKAKGVLTSYVQSKMNVFAPNLTRLIGSETAAQLLNARGGLKNLAQTSASNIPSIGSTRAAHSGFATNVGIRNQGFLFQSLPIRQLRPELKIQGMRIVAAKLVLAARADLVHTSPDGSIGDDLLEQCEKRLDKLTEPAPNRGQKALPAPDEKLSKKRGGRRARKAKEANAMTDIRKAQNRMAFGKEEKEIGYGTGDSTVGMGMIGASNDGRIRALQVDQRTRAKLSKKNAGWGVATPAGNGAASSLRGFGSGAAGNATSLKGYGLRTAGVATSVGGGAGTASSLNFGAKTGIELVDPKVRAEMERKNRAEENKYFQGGTFTQAGGGSSVTPKAAANGNGFKVPALPQKRKHEG